MSLNATSILFHLAKWKVQPFPFPVLTSNRYPLFLSLNLIKLNRPSFYPWQKRKKKKRKKKKRSYVVVVKVSYHQTCFIHGWFPSVRTALKKSPLETFDSINKWYWQHNSFFLRDYWKFRALMGWTGLYPDLLKEGHRPLDSNGRNMLDGSNGPISWLAKRWLPSKGINMPASITILPTSQKER